MITNEDIIIITQRVETILTQTNIRHHFTGGLVASYYGEPRYTQDIDIVIIISIEKLKQLLTALEKEFFVNIETTLREFSSKQIFQAFHKETAIKIDFHVGTDVEGELERSIVQEILPETIVPIVSRADAVSSKLIWIKKGSHKSRLDLRMIWHHCSENEKMQVREFAKKNNLESLLNEVLAATID